MKLKKKHNKPSTLEQLDQQRTGGAVNIRGVSYQLLFITSEILTRLSSDHSLKARPEGLEDLDILSPDGDEHIQVKTSVNPVDASTLWNLQVLQHFLDLDLLKPGSNFRVAHNNTARKGSLDNLVSGPVTLSYWHKRFSEAGYDLNEQELSAFLARVTLQTQDEQSIQRRLLKALYEHYGVTLGSEDAYVHAFFFHVADWSRNRQVIGYDDLVKVIQLVRDSFSVFPSNPALANHWIEEVSFATGDSTDSDDYYEGKSARPRHIALGLPVKREQLEKELLTSIETIPGTVIKSSSGQGKSTLAWQAAWTMKQQGWKIYQVSHCPGQEEASAVTDFIRTRLVIGQRPLIVIDGLDGTRAAWKLVAEKLVDTQAKILLTAREEDWQRHGADISKFALRFIGITLSMSEASAIYTELKKRGKIHPDNQTWQPAWEKIKDRGLLIEYVYLLTRGEMLSDRISQQVRALSIEHDGPAKAEILRLISLADIMNLRIKTSKLSTCIASTVSFQSDRNEVYRQLEKEYYLRFDVEYVEGLHAVRSSHLTEQLHSHTPKSESLIKLLGIVEPENVYEFFMGATQMLEPAERRSFLRQAAQIMAERPAAEIVASLDGVMHMEPVQFLSANAEVFDTVFNAGGIDLFIMDSTPFLKEKFLPKFADSMAGLPGSGIQFLLEQSQRLTPYSLAGSDLVFFVNELQSPLSKRNLDNETDGIDFLANWFLLSGVDYPVTINRAGERMMALMETGRLEAAATLARCFQAVDRSAYEIFVDANRNKLFTLFKKHTDTLSMVVEDGKLKMMYLLELDKADTAHEQSMHRVDLASTFFLGYSNYCTDAEILPFPSKELVHASWQNAQKGVSEEYLNNDFEVHLNRIWIATIMARYAAPSAYDFQKHLHELRSTALAAMKKCTRLFEFHLLGSDRVNALSKEVVAQVTTYFKFNTEFRNYPVHNSRYFEEKLFKNEQKAIRDYLQSLSNFFNQMSGIFKPTKEQDRNLPVVNLKNAIDHVGKMQAAVAEIVKETTAYFTITGNDEEEKVWLERLLRTVQCYIHKSKGGELERVIIPEKTVNDWWQQKKQEELDNIVEIIEIAALALEVELIAPDRILEKELLTTVVIGLVAFDMTDEEQFLKLSIALADLSKTDITYCLMVYIDPDGHPVQAMRLNMDYFTGIAYIVENDQPPKEELPIPLPVTPSQEELRTIGLEAMKPPVQDATATAYCFMLQSAWKLSRYRHYLNAPDHKAWLMEVETQIARDIEKNIAEMEPRSRYSVTIEKIRDYIKGSGEVTEAWVLENLADETHYWPKKLLHPFSFRDT